MVELLKSSATALRMWGLPGASLGGMDAEFADGLIRLGSTPRRSPCPTFLVEHPKGLVLFDTGLNPAGLDDPGYFGDIAQGWNIEFDREAAVDFQLRSLGYQPSDIRYVIPSHLHFDHAGGIHLFPESTIIVGAGEIRYAYWPPPSQQIAFIVADLLPTRSFDWLEIDADLDLFGDGSIVVLHTPGHTPGELSLLVRLPSRTLLLTGDVCHFCVELEHGFPAFDLPCSDADLAARSIRRVRLLRDTLPAEVWIGHEPLHWAQFPHAPEALT